MTTSDSKDIRTYTEAQALAEATRLLCRKLLRLAPGAYGKALAELPEGARHTLNLAELRANKLRDEDEAHGIERAWARDTTFDLEASEKEPENDEH